MYLPVCRIFVVTMQDLYLKQTESTESYLTVRVYVTTMDDED